jgi:hypothetical protein
MPSRKWNTSKLNHKLSFYVKSLPYKISYLTLSAQLPDTEYMAQKKSRVKPTNFSSPLVWVLLIAALILGGFLGKHLLTNGLFANQIVQAPAANAVLQTPADWKMYTNVKYGYSVSYPPTIDVYNTTAGGNIEKTAAYPLIAKSTDTTQQAETADSIDFNSADDQYSGPPPYSIAVISYPSETAIDTTPLSQETLNKIFALQVGEELDSQTSKNIDGDLPNLAHYKRLRDITVNSNTFVVIENPNGHGGLDRRLFLRKSGKVFITGKTYNNAKTLHEFELFYSSLKFTN